MKKMQIAIFNGASDKWSAGGEYTQTQVCSILKALESGDYNADLLVANYTGKKFILPDSVSNNNLRFIKMNISDYLSTAQLILRKGLGAAWRDPRNKLLEKLCDDNQVDVVFSNNPPEWWQHKSVGLCCWIPDFQHVHLPEYFSAEEIRIRNEIGHQIAEQADVVILSSKNVQQDFITFAPEYADKTRIYQFPSQYAFSDNMKKLNADAILDKYDIKKGFFLVVNQFFAHKNHEQVIEAVAKLKYDKDCPQIVMIGQPVDYRDPCGNYISKILSMIAEYGIESKIKILGYVSREEKDVLLRSCRVLVQPSRFEGWNTSIEDAKALGKSVIASDLDVHHEQLGDDAYGYFEINNVDELSALLKSASDVLPDEIDYNVEKSSLDAARDGALVAGRWLLEIAESVRK